MDDFLYFSIIPVKSFNNKLFRHFFVEKQSKIILKYETLPFDIMCVHRVSIGKERKREKNGFIRKH